MQSPAYQIRTLDGRVWGPLTDAQVRASISAGSVTPNTMIAPYGEEGWTPVWQHPEYGPLARALPPAGLSSASQRKRLTPAQIASIVTASVLALALLVGLPIYLMAQSGKQILHAVYEESDKPQTLVDAKRTVQLTLPAGWKRETETDGAALEASGQLSSLYASVVTESREELGEELTVQEYSDVARPEVLSQFKGPQEEGPRLLKVNGHPAVQYELAGVLEGNEVVILHTTIKTRKRYHQVMLTALKEQLPGYRKELEGILHSFQEPK